VDWNNDGKKDLIVGERDGHIRIYLNTNNDEIPVFDGYTYLLYKGVPFDCDSTAMPVIKDWNNDGKKDVLCGEDYGCIYLLINEGTDADPVFNSVSFIADGQYDLDVGTRSSPAVTDWNGDGKKDLIVGEALGKLFYYENKGTDAEPLFDGWKWLITSTQIICVGEYSRPVVKDWDDDGVTDIICGCQDFSAPNDGGYVHWFHAKGPLFVDQNSIAAGTGSEIEFFLDAGAANADRKYFLVGSVSGTLPGTPLPGGLATLPINWDPVTDIIVSLLNTAMFQNFTGILNSGGEAQAVLDTLGPWPPAAVGAVLSFAYALNGPWDYASNGLNIEIVP
jgi:hypothetical protein